MQLNLLVPNTSSPVFQYSELTFRGIPMAIWNSKYISQTVSQWFERLVLGVETTTDEDKYKQTIKSD